MRPRPSPDWPVFGHRSRFPAIPLKINKTPSEIPRPPQTRMLLSSSKWEPTPIHLFTSVQQSGVDALAAGSTLTDTAKTYGVHRVTIYRWMKTSIAAAPNSSSPAATISTNSATAPSKS